MSVSVNHWKSCKKLRLEKMRQRQIRMRRSISTSAWNYLLKILERKNCAIAAFWHLCTSFCYALLISHLKSREKRKHLFVSQCINFFMKFICWKPVVFRKKTRQCSWNYELQVQKQKLEFFVNQIIFSSNHNWKRALLDLKKILLVAIGYRVL